MALRIAINGYGRIGRSILRAVYECGYRDRLQIVAINDPGEPQAHAHLTRYDSTHGRFAGDVDLDGSALLVNGDSIQLLRQSDPQLLPWTELDIDLVLECTGRFASKTGASAHLQAGARRVLVSQPAGEDVKTVVYGVNHAQLTAQDALASNASCTTNCLAVVLKPILDSVGFESGMLTTAHAYTNDQVLADAHHSDLRRARSATQSIVPTRTGAALALSRVLPQMAGRMDGLALRVPTLNVAMVDLNFRTERKTSVQELNALMQDAAQGDLKGLLGYCDTPLVSIDYNHDSRSGVFDATLSKVSSDGRMVKVCAWYDNEWGFSNRMLDTALAWAAAR